MPASTDAVLSLLEAVTGMIVGQEPPLPLTFEIDHERRLVLATGVGMLTDDDVFGYQRSAWSRPDVAGYDELIDVTAVSRIEVRSSDRVRDLAAMAARMDRAQ